jgi:two-component system chemotaxis response regulator CheY
LPAGRCCEGRTTVDDILVVDDDPAIRDVVVDILEMSEYAVRTASNGAEALDEVRQRPPAAILLDLMMPVMNGWEFLRHCRGDAACAGVPIVVMSAARDAATAADELGAHAFLPKPFELDDVLTIVDRLARGAAGLPK